MKTAFSRRGPDIVTEELAAVLSKKTAFEFKPLFEILHANLRARNAANGGEEMLRLRAYEKLQVLVQQGVVQKLDKKYKGVPSALNKFIAAAAEANAKFAAPAPARTSLPVESPAKPSTSKGATINGKNSAPAAKPKESKAAATHPAGGPAKAPVKEALKRKKAVARA